MMYQFERPFIVDSSKFVKAFGDISTPYPEALRRTIAWYRQFLHAASDREKTESLGGREYAIK
jgi:hypothetical protein